MRPELRTGFPRGHERDLSGFLVTRPVPCPALRPPGRTGEPDHSGFPDTAPGRASNPLGHVERFQITFFPLSRTCPDASWAHDKRKFFELARLTKAPIAAEAVKRIDVLFAIERKINGLAPQERLRLRQERSRT
ncbi:hypothetical protein ACVWYH_001970 [Bradyrhizobium sp. GM24.11]